MEDVQPVQSDLMALYQSTRVLWADDGQLESTEVDKLANIGRMASSEVDERKHIKKVRDDILSASITLFNAINKKVEVLNGIETNGPSVVTDDFSACANADQERNLLL